MFRLIRVIQHNSESNLHLGSLCTLLFVKAPMTYCELYYNIQAGGVRRDGYMEQPILHMYQDTRSLFGAIWISLVASWLQFKPYSFFHNSVGNICRSHRFVKFKFKFLKNKLEDH